jgi:hypothetical protein
VNLKKELSSVFQRTRDVQLSMCVWQEWAAERNCLAETQGLNYDSYDKVPTVYMIFPLIYRGNFIQLNHFKNWGRFLNSLGNCEAEIRI